MANLHSLFLKFDKKLNLTTTKLKLLKTSEKNIKKYIKAYFKEKHPNLNFSMVRQGSFVLNTMIRTQNDYCDVDFGVRFFPIPKNLQPITLQKYVKEALANVNNSTFPIHKKKCIRLEYKTGYHVDVTVYGLEGFTPKLATKDSWEDSDPSKFKKWFNEAGKKNQSQLKRIVKYLKAWSDYKGKKILKGISITVLAGLNFVPNKRDDISLKETITKILIYLSDEWTCKMPVYPNDDLIDTLSLTNINELQSRLDSFIRDSEIAISKQTNDSRAVELWKRHLGTYFSK